MAMSLGKFMTCRLRTMEPLKPISATNQVLIPVWHIVGLHSLACLWLGGDHGIILVNELCVELPRVMFKLEDLISRALFPFALKTYSNPDGGFSISQGPGVMTTLSTVPRINGKKPLLQQDSDFFFLTSMT